MSRDEIRALRDGQSRAHALLERALIHLGHYEPRPLVEGLTEDERIRVLSDAHHHACAVNAVREASKLLVSEERASGRVIDLGMRRRIADEYAAQTAPPSREDREIAADLLDADPSLGDGGQSGGAA